MPVTKTAALRYLSECTGHGYVLYQQGEIEAAKAQALVEKFDDLYQVLASRGVRDHARKAGRSCARLVMFPKTDAGDVMLFWLLATEGTGPLAGQGNTRDARNHATRLTWCGQYELLARPVRRRGSGELKHVWTWCMSDRSYQGWTERLKKAAGRVRSSQERKPDYLVQQIELLRRVPGFHAINRQKRALILAADIPREWHEKLQLRELGTTVDKKLAIFDAGGTLQALIAGPPAK